MANTHTFRPISRISKWLVNLSIASIIIAIIYDASSFVLLFLFKDTSYQDSSFVFLVDQIKLVIIIVIAIITLYWYFRADKNIHAFGAKQVTSPAMSVIWWFIPIAFLWKPHSVAQQIWKASNPEIKLTEGTEWRKGPSSNIVRLWWIMGILAILISVLIGIFLEQAFAQSLFEPYYVTEPNLVYEGLLIILSNIPRTASTVFFIRMIRQISTWQEIKAGVKS
jgi:hypothetical protein